MSKELEALEKVLKYCDIQYCDEEIYVIETALKENDYLKTLNENQKHNIELLKEENKMLVKSLKALKIIKKKASIDVLEELNEDEPYWLDIVCSTELTQEEYDLLKEVLYENNK